MKICHKYQAYAISSDLKSVVPFNILDKRNLGFKIKLVTADFRHGTRTFNSFSYIFSSK